MKRLTKIKQMLRLICTSLKFDTRFIHESIQILQENHIEEEKNYNSNLSSFFYNLVFFLVSNNTVFEIFPQ